MPAPDRTAPVEAVRALLGALGVPAIGQALALENALAAKLADLNRAPQAAGFDPLARPPAGAVPAKRHQSAADVARRKQPSPTMPERALVGGIGALLGDALAGKPSARRPAPALGTLAGIGAALAGLPAPPHDKAKARNTRRASRPVQAPQTGRAIALATTGAVSDAAGLAAHALAVLPGSAGVVPVLGQIAALGNALWWQMALAPPAAQSAASPPPVELRPARRGQGVAGTQAGGPPGHRQPAIATRSTAQAGLRVDGAQSALAGIGKLTVELFDYVAGTAGEAPAPPHRQPAPRAPSVLAPARGERSAPPAPGAGTPPLASASTRFTSVARAGADADDLARVLRAEGLLRGADLA